MQKIFLFLCLSICLVFGEDKVRGLQARFVAQHLPQGLPAVVAAAGEEISESFKIPKNNLSEPVAIPARQFILQTESPAKPLAKVTFPEKGTDFIVLLVPDQKDVFRSIVLDSRNSSFRPGDFYLLNTSKETVVGKVGTTQCLLKPGEGKVVRPEGAREERFYDVLLGVRMGANSAIPISSSRWPVSTTMRTYVFFFDDAAKKAIDFRAVDEFVPSEKQ